MSAIKLGIPQPILFQWRIAGVSCPRGLGFADVRDAGVWSCAVEPDSLDAGAEVVFAEFVVFGAGDDLGHVGVLHWEDYVGVGGLGASGLSFWVGHERSCVVDVWRKSQLRWGEKNNQERIVRKGGKGVGSHVWWLHSCAAARCLLESASTTSVTYSPRNPPENRATTLILSRGQGIRVITAIKNFKTNFNK